MKDSITFELVHKTANQRFYKSSRPLTKDASGKDYRYVNWNGERTIKIYADKEKKTTKDFVVPSEFCGVVVSDAHTHLERLTFPMWEFEPIVGNNPYIFVCDNIAGALTFMTHGGDSRSMKPDAVYLRMIAKGNGYQYKRNSTND